MNHRDAVRPSTAEFQFNFREFQIGTAEVPDGPTGCTVFRFPPGTTAVADVRGGSAATRETALLEAASAWNSIDGLVLAGGSTYGLAAADGVMTALKEERGHSTRFQDIPCVPAAVVYDFAGRTTSHTPTAALGAKAWSALREGAVTLGRAGAGVNVSVGKLLGRASAEAAGQGASFLRVGPYRFFGLVVLNAFGHILGPDGQTVAGSRNPETGKRLSGSEVIQEALTRQAASAAAARTNTTLSVLITDAPLDRSELTRLSMAAHTGMGRVIEPFQTAYDGDVLFGVRVPGIQEGGSVVDPSILALAASKVLQEAVWSAVL